ncbi:MAG: hypothetical protein QOE03_4102 [Micromonosporaceae bacterium]|nr:hypothetical protein [Micromonosporaceae bacterium]
MTDNITTLAAPAAVDDALRSVALFVPKFLAFLVIVIIGWLVARLLRVVVGKALTRVGFDRVVERGGVKAALSRSRYDATDIMARLVYYAVLLFTLQLAFGVWGPNPVSDLIKGIVAWLPKAFVAIVIVVVAAAIANAVRDVVANVLSALSYGRLLANVASWFIIGIGVIAALNQIGVATTVTTPVLIAVLATVAGILIVGVGGGLVRPMQQRWDDWLDRVSAESSAIAEHAKAYTASQRDASRAVPTDAPSTAAPSEVVAEPAATGPAVPAQPSAPQAPIPQYTPGSASPTGGSQSTTAFPKQTPVDDTTMVIPPVPPSSSGDTPR